MGLDTKCSKEKLFIKGMGGAGKGIRGKNGSNSLLKLQTVSSK